jgi:energy-coupling factor transporter ATP-binding protein EcfA2
VQLLGGQFDFETDSARLLRIVRQAYARLPAHRLAAVAPRLRIRLLITPGATARAATRTVREPPPVRPLAGAGILGGAMGCANFVALTPRQHAALIVVARDMLRYAYHIRYELLEFAVYVLAARVQRLVPLHAACLGYGKHGLLLIGPSGSGKSTVVLHGLLAGLDFLAEDSVLVKPQGLLATGVANFVHLRRDSLRFFAGPERATLIRRSSVIRRRSGVEKLEIDLRRPPYRLAGAPLPIRAVVFISARSAGSRALLTRLSTSVVLERLAASQRYATQQPGWRAFRERVARLPGYELRRGPHPLAAVEAVRRLLAAPSKRPDGQRPTRRRAASPASAAQGGNGVPGARRSASRR